MITGAASYKSRLGVAASRSEGWLPRVLCSLCSCCRLADCDQRGHPRRGAARGDGALCEGATILQCRAESRQAPDLAVVARAGAGCCVQQRLSPVWAKQLGPPCSTDRPTGSCRSAPRMRQHLPTVCLVRLHVFCAAESAAPGHPANNPPPGVHPGVHPQVLELPEAGKEELQAAWKQWVQEAGEDQRAVRAGAPQQRLHSSACWRRRDCVPAAERVTESWRRKAGV